MAKFKLDVPQAKEFVKTRYEVVALGAAGALALEPVFVINQKRMVVVSATFPYFEQAELYRKALRVERIEDLFARGLAPALEGLNVQRRKITTAGGKTTPGEWENVYM